MSSACIFTYALILHVLLEATDQRCYVPSLYVCVCVWFLILLELPQGLCACYSLRLEPFPQISACFLALGLCSNATSSVLCSLTVVFKIASQLFF